MRIALTGGIASGKSTVAARLQELGAVILDADVFARDAVSPGSRGLQLVRNHFGEGVITPDGELDRAALSAIVFHDEAEREALEGILHPEIRRLAAERLAEVLAADPAAVTVHVIPLLVETGQAGDFDEVWVADAPAECRVQRLVEGRQMTPSDARARVASQATDEQRRAIADVLIDTAAPLESTLARVEQEWARVRSLGGDDHCCGTQDPPRPTRQSGA